MFGTAVNRAARITARAKGGKILVSDVVRDLANGKDFLLAGSGEANLKVSGTRCGCTMSDGESKREQYDILIGPGSEVGRRCSVAARRQHPMA